MHACNWNVVFQPKCTERIKSFAPNDDNDKDDADEMYDADDVYDADDMDDADDMYDADANGADDVYDADANGADKNSRADLKRQRGLIVAEGGERGARLAENIHYYRNIIT